LCAVADSGRRPTRQIQVAGLLLEDEAGKDLAPDRVLPFGLKAFALRRGQIVRTNVVRQDDCGGEGNKQNERERTHSASARLFAIPKETSII
jgi:hypothetical protein